MKTALAILVSLVLFPSMTVARSGEPDETFFEQKVRPILAGTCQKCHGAKKQEAGLRLDARQGLIQGGETGPAIVPGDPAKSLLIQAVTHAGDLAMPPDRRLSDVQIADLKRWVELGAPWPAGDRPVTIRTGEITEADRRFWSFQPLAHPPIPAVANRSWIRTDVDAFILAKLETNGISPSPLADRRTLIRRATFDLTGLPPTPREVSDFLADSSPDPFARVVDRLLASPRYGERWGRHWLDVVRYADTAGETADFPVREVHLYRDYVIAAFNNDKPYDQFLREQVAGDLLGLNAPPERYAEMVTATGFLAISRRFGFDPENYQHLTIQDSIDTLGQAFLGLSVGCARCHHHKFDPITTSDYYALYGIFDSTRYAFPGSEEKRRPRDFAPLVPPSEAGAKKKTFDEALAKFTAEIQSIDARKKATETELKSLVGLDGSFETHALAAGPGRPWGFVDGARVTGASQSPFTNVFPSGSRGISLPNNSANNAIEQALPRNRTPASDNLVHLNLDVRVVDSTGGGDGSYRIYLGHGPGNSAAIELYFNSRQFVARSGDVREAIRELKAGVWYNLQVVADLDKRTYSGTIGVPGDLTPFSARAFSTGWDGNLDYFFVDGYGHLGGNKPASELDNIAIQDDPFAPPGESPSGEHGDVGLDRQKQAAALRATLDGLAKERTELERSASALTMAGPYPVAYGMSEGQAHNARIQKRGEPTILGDEVPRRFLQILGGDAVPPDSGSGRLDLANWITRPGNPLTARVMANRVWQHHFGQGLVATENDFGRRGQAPSHPELLDFLSIRFRDGGWSIKSLHRQIMLSSTYRLSGAAGPELSTVDPGNALLSHFPRRRLDAEEIRDAMLSAAGTLDLSPAGPHPFPPVETWGFTQHAPFNAVYETRHRSVYLMNQRLKRHPFLALFDGPDTNSSTARRLVTTVPTQSLFFMNDPFLHEQAAALAGRILASSADDAERLTFAFETAFARVPTVDDRDESLAFLAAEKLDFATSGVPASEAERRAWSALTRTLLARNEFLFVD
ncbi:MAG: Protein of unknown function (DUF1553)/Protein of unknown function (DUF1549)/Planctomycete [Planctomycetota bacterium]|nr:Protein of unknown function (DUF1553)/Protein of unknown function (DUF1549)/Planctomycete [Planctomycetota bacterium]